MDAGLHTYVALDAVVRDVCAEIYLLGTISLSSMSSSTWLAVLCRVVRWQRASLSFSSRTACLRRSTLPSLQAQDSSYIFDVCLPP